MEVPECSNIASKKQKMDYLLVGFDFSHEKAETENDYIFAELYRSALEGKDLHKEIDKVCGLGEKAIVEACKKHEREMYTYMMQVDLLESNFKYYILDNLSIHLWPYCEEKTEQKDDIYSNGLSFDLSNDLYCELYATAQLELGTLANKSDGDIKNFKMISRKLCSAFPLSIYGIILRNILRRRIRLVCQQRTGNEYSYDKVPLPIRFKLS